MGLHCLHMSPKRDLFKEVKQCKLGHVGSLNAFLCKLMAVEIVKVASSTYFSICCRRTKMCYFTYCLNLKKINIKK